jgi:hypothetical protein
MALFGAERANAGYAVAPNGQSFTVALDSNGYLTPQAIDLVIYLDAQDSSPYVWVSETSSISAYGTPSGGGVGGCSAGTLIPFGEQNKWVCRASTILMKPNRTYYWWLSFRRQDPGQTFASDRVSGPFSFSLVQQAAPPQPPPVEEPPVEEPPPADPHARVSSKTVEAAATLPSSVLFNGTRSVKHTTLTRLVYKTMRRLNLPRSLAFACWNRADWLSVLAAEDAEPTRGGSTLLGFWQPRQPRWLHLAPGVCTDVQGLLSSKKPNARRAGALATVIHETLHAYGVINEAQTNCWAVQLVPFFGLNLGMSVARSDYLGTLARNYVRARAPAGYWNAGRCRDNGAWDLFTWRNLG